jgi:hypothetical protein
VLPENAWLTQLEASAPPIGAPGAAVPPGTEGTSNVLIKGATFSHDTVATVLARLSVVPSLTNVRLTSTALVAPEEDESSKAKAAKPFITFDVSASVKTGDTR